MDPHLMKAYQHQMPPFCQTDQLARIHQSSLSGIMELAGAVVAVLRYCIHLICTQIGDTALLIELSWGRGRCINCKPTNTIPS